MTAYTLKFQEINKTKLALVGGKGANLGELSSTSGVQVPEGFCITTEAFKEVVETNGAFESLLEQLSVLNMNDTKRVSEAGAKIRKLMEHMPRS